MALTSTSENVGGEHLEAVLTNMNSFGRIPVCGMISQYNNTEPEPGPSNLSSMIGKRLLLQGFIVSDHYDQLPQFQVDMMKWIQAGKLQNGKKLLLQESRILPRHLSVCLPEKISEKCW